MGIFKAESAISLGGIRKMTEVVLQFKPNRGDYAADQALYTVEAKSYEPKWL
jgi:hypothetical protein